MKIVNRLVAVALVVGLILALLILIFGDDRARANTAPQAWSLVWAFNVQHPDGEITERTILMDQRFATEELCWSKAQEAERVMQLENITEDGGDAIFSRWICLPQ